MPDDTQSEFDAIVAEVNRLKDMIEQSRIDDSLKRQIHEQIALQREDQSRVSQEFGTLREKYEEQIGRLREETLNSILNSTRSPAQQPSPLQRIPEEHRKDYQQLQDRLLANYLIIPSVNQYAGKLIDKLSAAFNDVISQSTNG